MNQLKRREKINPGRGPQGTCMSEKLTWKNMGTTCNVLNPKRFLNLLTSQRLLRRLDEVHLLDSSANIIMSNIIDPSINFIPPTEAAFNKSLEGKPVRILDQYTNRTSALVKLNSFIDTYL